MSEHNHTDTAPPDIITGDDGDGEGTWSSVEVSVALPDGNRHEICASLYDSDAHSPDRFATELLGAALAAAQMRGPDFYWATMRRLAHYQTGPA